MCVWLASLFRVSPLLGSLRINSIPGAGGGALMCCLRGAPFVPAVSVSLSVVVVVVLGWLAGISIPFGAPIDSRAHSLHSKVGANRRKEREKKEK